MNYKAMSDMVLFRHTWRTIVKDKVYRKFMLPKALFSELEKRDWDAKCLYCDKYQHYEGCGDCPLVESYGREHSKICVPPFYSWYKNSDIEGAKQILEVIEKDMGG